MTGFVVDRIWPGETVFRPQGFKNCSALKMYIRIYASNIL